MQQSKKTEKVTFCRILKNVKKRKNVLIKMLYNENSVN